MRQGLLPSGTVTFLFTDIEGSTKLWEAHPETMRVSLARHDELMRLAIAASNGYVFKTVGDAFCAAFDTAAEAVDAVLAAQLALTSEPWPEETRIKVRMALHTGAVEERDGDYFGPPVNRVARLLSTSYGEQVIVSAATQELIRDDLPAGSQLRNLGEHRLKDLGRPETVFQLLHESLRSDFPPLRSLDNPELRHNLPQQVTSFVGREKELGELRSLLERTRLLTMTGSGGSGKTRLALQTAADHLDGTGDGVWLVELASLTDDALVPQAVANALGVKEEPGEPIGRTLLHFLKPRRLLLVLDNCEHLLNACSSLADSIHRGCPHVSILATSREGLGIAGETTYRVPSLTLPNPGHETTPDYLSQFEAVRLFVDRAVQVQTTFAVTNANAPALGSICHRLDGIPLAIELAAARVRSLTVEDINAKLDQRFRLLTGGLRTALPRQQTLRSMIDWSYDLLRESERTLLERLSVFAGGWTLAGAETVCAGGAIDALDVLDLLESLCEKSLVVSESYGPSSRYRMLETVRHYSAEKLAESGERDAVLLRHRDYFLSLAVEFGLNFRTPAGGALFARLTAEEDNLRAAMDWTAAAPNQSAEEAGFCDGLRWFWTARGCPAEGLERCRSALSRSRPEEISLQRADLLRAYATVSVHAYGAGTMREVLLEELTIRRRIGDPMGEAAATLNLGYAAKNDRDYEAARKYYREAHSMLSRLGDDRAALVALMGEGNVEEEDGNLTEALSILGKVIQGARDADMQFVLQWAYANLALTQARLGQAVEGLRSAQDSLRVSQSLGDKSAQSQAILIAGLCLEGCGHPRRAVRMLAAALAALEQTGGAVAPSDAELARASESRLREQMPAADFEANQAEGGEMSLEEAVALALADEGDRPPSPTGQ